MDMQKDRCLGAFFGLAIGDALGAQVETFPGGKLPWVKDYTGGGPLNLAPGEWSDKTALAIATANGLATSGTLAGIECELRRWYREGAHTINGKCIGIDDTCKQTITKGFGVVSDWSQSVGGLVRVAPIPIFLREDGPRFIEIQSGYMTSSTHGNGICIESSSVLGGYITRLVRGMSFDRVIGSVRGINCKSVVALNKGRWLKEKQYSELSSSGLVVDTLEAAIYCVNTASSFDEAIQLAVNLAGDASATGSVTGQLAGARWGFSGIPDRLIDGLQGKGLIYGAFNGIYC